MDAIEWKKLPRRGFKYTVRVRDETKSKVKYRQWVQVWEGRKRPTVAYLRSLKGEWEVLGWYNDAEWARNSGGLMGTILERVAHGVNE